MSFGRAEKGLLAVIASLVVLLIVLVIFGVASVDRAADVFVACMDSTRGDGWGCWNALRDR